MFVHRVSADSLLACVVCDDCVNISLSVLRLMTLLL